MDDNIKQICDTIEHVADIIAVLGSALIVGGFFLLLIYILA